MKKIVIALLALLLLAGPSLTSAGKPSKKNNQPTLSVQAMYEEARKEFDSENYANAIKLYEALEAQYPSSIAHSQQAKMDKAYAYYKDNQPQQALKTIENFIKLYPTHTKLDYLYYLQALVHYGDNAPLHARWNKPARSYRGQQSSNIALELFQKFLHLYPQSQYIPSAQQNIQQIMLDISQHELHITHYYMKRGAYIAAINRAQVLLTKYTDTPYAEEALAIKIAAYKKLGQKALSDEAKKTLQLKYPHSIFLKMPWKFRKHLY